MKPTILWSNSRVHYGTSWLYHGLIMVQGYTMVQPFDYHGCTMVHGSRTMVSAITNTYTGETERSPEVNKKIHNIDILLNYLHVLG